MDTQDDRRWRIFDEINQERVRQDARWGEQNHPDVDRVLTERAGGCGVARMCEKYGIPHPIRAQANCDGAAEIGQATWAHILVEEIAEAVEAATLAQTGRGSRAALRKELVQVAAVAVSWIEAIARRGSE